GKSEVLDVTVDAVGLPMKTSRFTKFKQADYDAIYKKLVDDTDSIRTNIKDNTAVKAANELKTAHTKVTVVS
ncbi:MAG: BMP family ABC transporter substrate-binding protein, partial [Oscillospiraceae bacterium]